MNTKQSVKDKAVEALFRLARDCQDKTVSQQTYENFADSLLEDFELIDIEFGCKQLGKKSVKTYNTMPPLGAIREEVRECKRMRTGNQTNDLAQTEDPEKRLQSLKRDWNNTHPIIKKKLIEKGNAPEWGNE